MRVTCFTAKPSVVSASFKSSILASVSEQKSNDAFSAVTSLSFESVSFRSSVLGAVVAAALLHSGQFASILCVTRWPKVV